LLLTVDGFVHVVERLVVDQAMTTVFPAETLYKIVLMFEHSPTQIVRHSNVEYARFAGYNVDAVVVSFHGGCRQQVPPLRIAIGGTNRNAPVGMTEILFVEIDDLNCKATLSMTN
jgi:hypothetical protein